MIKWEYKTLDSSNSWLNLQLILNSMGLDGWELAGEISSYLVFKRPINKTAVDTEDKEYEYVP